jgi:hypothetical protein
MKSSHLFTKKIKSNIPKHLEVLDNSIDVDTCEDIEYLDTLAKAYHLVGRNEDKERACNRTLQLALSKDYHAFDNDVKFDIARDANELLSLKRDPILMKPKGDG